MNALFRQLARAPMTGIFSNSLRHDSDTRLHVNSDPPILLIGVTLSNAVMKTIEEIRREWVLVLIARFGTISALNKALGRASTDATLSQIKNQAVDSKSGNPKNMGSTLAREIEDTLGMPRGTLDHQPPENDADAAFIQRVEEEVAKYEVPDHIQQTIMTLIASSPEKNH